jgi:hypothetical protein
MHLPRAAAGPEVLVRDDTALVLEVPKKEKSSVASGRTARLCFKDGVNLLFSPGGVPTSADKSLSLKSADKSLSLKSADK